jgi:membrane associated rhomboid family serine protease
MAARFVRILLAALMFAIAGLAIGAIGGYWVGDLLIDWRIIKPNIDIDDDAAMINFGIATAGAAVGLVAGAVAGWRIARR